VISKRMAKPRKTHSMTTSHRRSHRISVGWRIVETRRCCVGSGAGDI
jgi:hypothetical protein